MLPRRQVVGPVGFEPTTSPRSERGAFAKFDHGPMVRTVRFELTLDSLSDCRLCQLGYVRLLLVGVLGFEPRDFLV
jgi:hypothetical protein